MKVLLVKPPQNPYLSTRCLYEPLELEYLAAAISDHEVRILDMRISRNLREEVVHFRPDILGVTGYTSDYNSVVNILKEVRQLDSSVITVVGGNHATFSPRDFALPFVNAVFIGYADSTFPMYLKAIGDPEKIKAIPDIAIVENKKLFFTPRISHVPDLNVLPLPDRSLTRKYHSKYHDAVRNRMSLLMTSRGCPYRCNFCACWKLMDGKYAARSPESLIEELKIMPKETRVVYFSDDNTFHDISRMWKLNSLLMENGIKKKFQMYARADTIVKNSELFRELAGNGLQFLTVGIESFSDKDLDYYGKRTSVEINNKAIRILKSLDIHIMAHFIVRPEYKAEDFRELYDYVSKNNLFRPAFPVLTPLPGTELYEETYKNFQIRNFDYFDFAHSILPTSLSSRDFYRQLTNLYVKSYSVMRIVRHKFHRLLLLKRNKYFTSNTDGVTVTKMIMINLYAISGFLRLRYSYLNAGNQQQKTSKY